MENGATQQKLPQFFKNVQKMMKAKKIIKKALP